MTKTETRAELKGAEAEVMAEMRHHYAATLAGFDPVTREIVELLMESAASAGYLRGFRAGGDDVLASVTRYAHVAVCECGIPLTKDEAIDGLRCRVCRLPEDGGDR